MTFGEKLFNLRSEAGFSQDKLAEMLDVSRQSVSKWERDEAMPDTDKIVLISRIFSVSTDSLLKSEEEIKETNKETEYERAERTQTTAFGLPAQEDNALKGKYFERGSLMDFINELIKVVKRHLSVLGLFMIISQSANLAASIFNAAEFYNYSDFDKTVEGIFYNSMHIGSIGALLGILTGIGIVIFGAVLRRKAGAENE